MVCTPPISALRTSINQVRYCIPPIHHDLMKFTCMNAHQSLRSFEVASGAFLTVVQSIGGDGCLETRFYGVGYSTTD